MDACLITRDEKTRETRAGNGRGDGRGCEGELEGGRETKRWRKMETFSFRASTSLKEGFRKLYLNTLAIQEVLLDVG